MGGVTGQTPGCDRAVSRWHLVRRLADWLIGSGIPQRLSKGRARRTPGRPVVGRRLVGQCRFCCPTGGNGNPLGRWPVADHRENGSSLLFVNFFTRSCYLPDFTCSPYHAYTFTIRRVPRRCLGCALAMCWNRLLRTGRLFGRGVSGKSSCIAAAAGCWSGGNDYWKSCHLR